MTSCFNDYRCADLILALCITEHLAAAIALPVRFRAVLHARRSNLCYRCQLMCMGQLRDAARFDFTTSIAPSGFNTFSSFSSCFCHFPVAPIMAGGFYHATFLYGFSAVCADLIACIAIFGAGSCFVIQQLSLMTCGLNDNRRADLILALCAAEHLTAAIALPIRFRAVFCAGSRYFRYCCQRMCMRNCVVLADETIIAEPVLSIYFIWTVEVCKPLTMLFVRTNRFVHDSTVIKAFSRIWLRELRVPVIISERLAIHPIPLTLTLFIRASNKVNIVISNGNKVSDH